MLEPPKSNTESKLKSWPSPQDYNEAIQDLRINIADPEISNGAVEVTSLGLPRPLTGSFASVYRVASEQRNYAVRCFLRDMADQNERYALISEFVQNDSLPYTVSFDFLSKGILVAGQWMPILKMDWVEGLTLDFYIEKHLGSDRIDRLASSLIDMCDHLRQAGIAHGDLQHGNIIVADHELRLVDYDGMFVPKMHGMKSNELGHRNYQHPRRDAEDFDSQLDNFSAWVIYTSIRCIALDEKLYHHLGAGDECLLFRRDDFIDPEHSYTFGLLENHPAQEVRTLTRFLRFLCKQAPDKAPPLAVNVPDHQDLSPLPKPAEGRSSLMPPRRSHEVVSHQIDHWENRALARQRREANVPGSKLTTAKQSSAQKAAPANPLALEGVEAELLEPGIRSVKFRDRYYMNPWTVQLLIVPLVTVLLCAFFWPLCSGETWLVALIAASFFLIAEFVTWPTPLKHKWLVQHGQPAIAGDVEVIYAKDKDGYEQVFVHYSFPASKNRLIRGKQKISTGEIPQVRKSVTQATVLFSRSNPEKNILYCLSRYTAVKSVPKAELVGKVQPELLCDTPRKVMVLNEYGKPWECQIYITFLLLAIIGFLGIVSGLFLIVPFVLLMYLIWRKSLKDLRLATNGLPAIGIVTSTHIDFGNRYGPIHVINYEFEDGNKKRFRDQMKVPESRMNGVRKGQKVSILYDASNPDASMIYQCSRYRAIE